MTHATNRTTWRCAVCLVGLISRAGFCDEGRDEMQILAAAKFQFGGVLGTRIHNNITQWLIRAPQSNPGLLAMFRLRDRQPAPELVPWAGEFVGKYLISTVQASRLSEDPELRETLRQVVDALLASQAGDGYLGPFPQQSRLLGNWDLWGHYHILQGLLMWHEQTGDERALRSCQRAADLICRIYLDSPRRVIQAGSPEMNLSVLHGLALLYRKTREERYLRLAQEIVKDFEQAGDYLRTGLSDVEFFQTPAPRWESLHCLQGMAEMYRITGDQRFRQAFLHHWNSIRQYDRRNSGAFSSGEKATGDPFADTQIETCCTIAWQAITIDALRLTGAASAADELELSTFNAVAGAQHPSGNWWTYDTPMNGKRLASAHSIVFQARPGTPELNCCSVNGPRGLGMLSEWAVMRSGDAVVLNYYGPMRASFSIAHGEAVTLVQETNYPVSDQVRVKLVTAPRAPIDLRLRIPAWSKRTDASLNGQPVSGVRNDPYLSVKRIWQPEDEIMLKFDMSLRYVPGMSAQMGRISLYRGPLLLAFDQRFNDFDVPDLPPIDVDALASAKLIAVDPLLETPRVGQYAPWLLMDVPALGGKTVRLCDFASAGSTGSQYRSWLPGE